MQRSRARLKPATVIVFAMLALTLTWPAPGHDRRKLPPGREATCR